MLTASRERGVIGCREIDAQHPDDRCQDALGLTQRSVEEETERQGGFDGEIGILELPAPPADASRCPRGDRVRREPEGDVASPHEGSVVLGPVPDAIRCRVLRMHSRLHIEIMTRRRSRWSTCRPLLAHRAESAHQRRVARARGRPPHSRPAPGSRTHRWRTPSRTPPRGTAPCATARLWRSRRPAATPAQGAEAMGDQANGGGGRRRESRWAAITRTRIPTVSRSHEIATNGTGSCRCEKRGARGRGVRPRRPAHPVPSRRSRRRRPLAPPRRRRSRPV